MAAIHIIFAASKAAGADVSCTISLNSYNSALSSPDLYLYAGSLIIQRDRACTLGQIYFSLISCQHIETDTLSHFY